MSCSIREWTKHMRIRSVQTGETPLKADKESICMEALRAEKKTGASMKNRADTLNISNMSLYGLINIDVTGNHNFI